MRIRAGVVTVGMFVAEYLDPAVGGDALVGRTAGV